MIERLQKLEFAQRRAFVGLAILRIHPGPNEVEANATFGLGDLGVTCAPVLVARPFADQLLEHIVAHVPVPLRRSNAGLLHGLAHNLGHRPIVGFSRTWLEPVAVPTQDRRHDPALGGHIAGRFPVSDTNTKATVPLKLAANAGCRAEDQRLDIGNMSLLVRQPVAAGATT